MNALQEEHLRVLEEEQKPKGACSEYARIGQEIRLAPQVLNALAEGKYHPIHYDLLVFCAAIEYADRRWRRRDTWSRVLRITIPVTELAIWQRPEVSESLAGVMRHLTCDTWHFDFVQAQTHKSFKGQTKIVFPEKKTFAIAYSEGLDSRAVWALSGPASEALCIRVAKRYNTAKTGDSLFTQIPFSVTMSESKQSRESSFRTRAFQFAAVTAIAAQIADLNRIVLPESGQGALGPALLPLHRIYADYRNYPTFFRKMEHFIHGLLKHEVHYEQTRLWSTKGQTMREFLKLPDQNKEHLINTRSCWQSRHIVNLGKRRQCGLCAACLLRRFSLYAADVKEPDDTYVIYDLSLSNTRDAMSTIPEKEIPSMLDHAIAGVRHFQQFSDMSNLPDTALKVHSLELSEAINTSEAETLKNLRTLLVAHAEEWRAFISAQGRNSFLLNWMDGGN